MKHPVVSVFAHRLQEQTVERLGERFTVHLNRTDTDYRRQLAEQRPHVLVTVGPRWQDFPHLAQMSDLNHRWLHFADEDALLNGLDGIGHCFVQNAVAPPRTPLLVSVFTGAYNCGSRILRAMDSLLRQTYEHWEWVVLDDASDDGETFELLAELASRAEAAGRVRVFCRAANSGILGDVKNAAAQLCRGDILVELDHDDELTDEALAWITATFDAHPDASCVYSDFVELDDSTGESLTYGDGWGLGFGANYRERHDDRWLTISSSPAINATTVGHIVSVPNHVRAWRRDFYHQIGGHNPELHVADDYELLLRTFLYGTLIHIPRLCYIQYRDKARSSQTFLRNEQIQLLVRYIHSVHQDALGRRCDELHLSPPVPSDDGYWLHGDCQTSASRREDPVGSRDSESPLVSVVIATYDRVELLERALDSVLRQTYQNLDVVVVGDSCPVIDQVLAGIVDQRVRYWNLQQHEGAAGTTPRNYALKMLCRGTLVSYLNDDNFWDLEHIESLVDLFRSQPTITYAFSSFYLGQTPIICRQPRRYLIDTSALLHRRELLERYGYWRSRAQVGDANDWELVSRWSREPWACSGRPTLSYNLETSQMDVEAIRVIHRVATEAHAETEES